MNRRSPPRKKQKTGEHHSGAAAAKVLSSTKTPKPSGDVLFESLPAHVLIGKVFSFVSPNDVTNLALTSRGMFQKIARLRNSKNKPCILWQERLPTGIVYNGIGDDLCLVSQLQPFQFLLRGVDGERLRIDFSLFNSRWQEHLNMKDGDGCSRMFPKHTKYMVRIQEKQYNGTWEEDFYCSTIKAGPPETIKSENISNHRWRKNLGFMFVCAKAIAEYPDDHLEYPSAEYLMQGLPKSIHEHFPPDFDWEKEHWDRNTAREFRYRPARTLAEWRGHAAVVAGDQQCYWKLDDIPWYREGYRWF